MRTQTYDGAKSLFHRCDHCNLKCDPKEFGPPPPPGYGDLYVLGKLWLKAVKAALLGSSMCMIPVVRAAQPPPPPTKPPPMNYKDLPLYGSPHNDYHEYVESSTKCSEANVKLMRRFLLPYVTTWRKEVQDKSCQLNCAVKTTICNTRKSISDSKKDFTATMRDNENLTMRKAVVAVGTGFGFLLGAGKSIPRRIFLTAAGATAGGALCFPKETDETFRDFTYYTGKTVIAVINWVCNKDLSWRERIACKDDLPGATNKIVGQCPQKK